MNTPAESPNSKDGARREDEIRGPEIGPALKRERLLQRVRAARRRLSSVPSAVPRLR